MLLRLQTLPPASPIIHPKNFGSLHLLWRRVKLPKPRAKPIYRAIVLGEVRLVQQHLVVPYGHIAFELGDEAFEDDFGDRDRDSIAENNLACDE
jgi:hypothetical protein